MLAAKTNNVEAVEMMLNGDANPNIADEKSRTALTYAIIAENIKSIEILILKTNSFLNVSLEKLAESNLTSPIIQIAVKEIISSCKEYFILFFNRVSIFGNADWLKWLLDMFPEFVPEFLEETIENVVMSDDPEACKIIFEKFKNFCSREELHRIFQLALMRGKRKVIETLRIKIPPKCKSRGFRLRSDIYSFVIKSEEFPYQDNIGKIVNKWLRKERNDIWVSLEDLLLEMKAPTVHYEDDSNKSSSTCPQECSQKRKCLRIRQTGRLIKDILKEMSKKYI